MNDFMNKPLPNPSVAFIALWLIVGFISALRFTYVMRVGRYKYSDIFASLFLGITGPLLGVIMILIAIGKKLDRPVFKNEGPHDWYKEKR
jgi:hypothetical protein